MTDNNSQLMFDAMGVAPDVVPETVPAAAPRPETWYKGRVLSHSSIQLYRTCPQKWKFKYVDKVPEKPRSFFSFGKSVHAGLEFLFGKLQEALPAVDDVLAHYRTGWLREGYESAAQEKWFFQEGERILKGFYAKHQGDFRRVVQVEFRFTVDIEGVPVMGFIDRIDETPSGKLAIIDYKTGKAFDKTRVRKDPQLTLYQMAVAKNLGRPVESVTLYHLNSLTPLTVPAHSPSQEEAMTAVVVEAAKGISANQFQPVPDEKAHCLWCDYQQICPALAGKKIGPSRSAVDEINLIADRYGKIDARINELAGERAALSEALKSHFQRSGTTELAGKEFRITLGDGEGRLEARPLNGEKRT